MKRKSDALWKDSQNNHRWGRDDETVRLGHYANLTNYVHASISSSVKWIAVRDYLTIMWTEIAMNWL